MGRDTATGLVLSGGTLQWCVLRRARNTIAVVAKRSASVELPAGPVSSLANVDDSDRAAVVSRIRSICSGIEKPVSTAISSGHVLLKAAELPTVDPSELHGMAELQVDKFSPFAPDNTVTACEVVSRGETSTRVVIIAADRRVVDNVGRILADARVAPVRVDVELLCWLNLIEDAGGFEKRGCRIIVLMDGVTCDAVVTKGGIPVLFRTFGKSVDMTAEDLVSDIESTLTQLESDHGIASPDGLMLWHAGEPPEETIRALGESFRFPVEHRPLSSLPPLSEGLARRSLDRRGLQDRANLALADWKTGREKAQVRKRILAATAAAMAVWLAGLACFGIAVALQFAGIKSRENTLKMLKPIADDARRMKGLIKTAGQFTDQRSAIECLREVVDAKPEGIEFQQFKYDRTREKKLTIKGEAVSDKIVYDYADALNKSSMFFGVEIKPLMSRGGKNNFTIELALARPAPKVPASPQSAKEVEP